MDNNQKLKDSLPKLADQFPHITEQEYTSQMLVLFQRTGLQLSSGDLEILLTLQQEI